MARYQKPTDPLPAVKSIQAGVLKGRLSSPPSGTADDGVGSVFDLTIATVDPAKSVADVYGAVTNAAGSLQVYFQNTNIPMGIPTIRILNANTIRISLGVNGANIDTALRWRVVEYN